MKLNIKYIVVFLLLVAALVMSSCASAPVEAPTEEIKEAEAPAEEADAEVEEEAEVDAEPVTLYLFDTWSDDPTHAKYAPLIAAYEGFMETYPHITLEWEAYGDHDMATKVNTMYLTGQEPDIVLLNMHQAALEWQEDGVALDALPYMEEWGLLEAFKENAVYEWTDSEGRLRAFPIEGYTWPVWYNTKILEEAGVGIPQTTDELIEVAAAVRAAGYQPYATGGAEWTGMFDFFLVLTTYLSDEEIADLYSNGGWSENPNLVKAVELFVELRDAGVFVDNAAGLTNAARNEMFYAEDAAIMHAGSWYYANCPDEIKDHIVLGGFPLPEGSTRSAPPIWVSFEAKGLWLTRNALEKIDAVETFVKYFFSEEVMARFVEDAAMISPLTVTTVDESALDPLFIQSMGLGEITEVALMHKVYVPPAGDDNLRRVASEAWVPGTTAETIIQNMDAVYENLAE